MHILVKKRRRRILSEASQRTQLGEEGMNTLCQQSLMLVALLFLCTFQRNTTANRCASPDTDKRTDMCVPRPL